LGRGALAQLRTLLEDARRTDAEQAIEHEATARELAGHTDPDSVIERELAEVCAARKRDALGEVEQALARMDACTYGGCEACGDPIPFERLRAVPQARFCVACHPVRPWFGSDRGTRGLPARFR
jgi:RNA polymerase-binding transcription factor DksA